MIAAMTEGEFNKFKTFIYDHAGIDLAPAKQVMVASRLNKRLNHYQLATYSEYFALVMDPDNKQEFQLMVDLLTTNETYFFR
ncbi:MAG: SAM-dependent methyltransferase, partial [Deltaproteobacteria bacterium]|nr:SAM-dependent methyltransferase [Deltaproteobacteria bacterium]